MENFFTMVLAVASPTRARRRGGSAVPAAESVEAVACLALDLLAVCCAPLLKLLRLLPAHAKTKPRRAGSETQAQTRKGWRGPTAARRAG